MDKIALILAAIALTLHGPMEVAPLPFLFKSRVGAQTSGRGIPKFIFEPLQNNIRMTMLIGLIFGSMRIIAVIGILANFMGAWVLGIAISLVTLIIMTFYLPMGIVAGIMSSITLISLLITYWGNQAIL